MKFAQAAVALYYTLSVTADPASCAVHHQAAVEVFEEALQKLPTARMYDLYAIFLDEQLTAVLNEASADKATKSVRRRAGEQANALLKLSTRAAEAGASAEFSTNR